ncbi:hypothetical protein [Falsiroseomonas sp.]|uniref:hypothetical protein n=1 Tax=Falsiroseomonas sp. TaxID=2870721 RepID=UPI002733BC77|nr:hypothetical protein [Falsiroseomonas sp.]MDP3417870.1 hypothetical protein [Falsiroseomonas sp.]
MSLPRLRAELRAAPGPTAEMLTRAFDLINPAGPRRDQFLRFVAAEAWLDAARLVVPEPYLICGSEQVACGGWCALGVTPSAAIRHFVYQDRAKTLPTAICAAALTAHEGDTAG